MTFRSRICQTRLVLTSSVSRCFIWFYKFGIKSAEAYYLLEQICLEAKHKNIGNDDDVCDDDDDDKENKYILNMVGCARVHLVSLKV